MEKTELVSAISATPSTEHGNRLTRRQPIGGFNAVDSLVIAALLVIEVLCFGLMAKQIGFYLDDWATFCQLHFAPHNFLDVLKASFSDPRMVTRPVQCLYYACTYMLFGDSPAGYHIVRCCIEVFGSVFLYLGLSRAVGRQLPAAIAAVLFLVFPTHDASHYWIGAGLGAGFGASLYLLSFWLAVEATRHRKTLLAVLSNLAFALCAYCYEAFLPMLSLTFFAVLFVEMQRANLPKALKATASFMVPSLLIGISEPIYQRAIVPMFSKVFLSPGTFSPSYAIDVFARGLSITVGPEGWTFFAERTREAVRALRLPGALRLVGIVAATVVAVCATARKDRRREPDDTIAPEYVRHKNLLYWSAASLAVMLCSYLTFAVAQGYTPTLFSMINRVNMGASIAASVLFGMLIAPATKTLRSHLPGALILTSALTIFYTLADWGCAPHWKQSWEVQKNIRAMVAQRADTLKTGDSILLANTPRYVMWAPVFDGVWDFQSMVWMTLNNRDINGGVVCERLDVTPEAIYDNSAGYLCATYQYANLNVLVPNGNQFIAVSSPQQFISTIENKGMDFGLQASTISRWRQKLAP